MASAQSARFAFSEGILMQEYFHQVEGLGSILSVSFTASDPASAGVRLHVSDKSGAIWNGFGPRPNHRAYGTVNVREKDIGAFALDGRFLRCQSSGKMTFSIKDSAIDITIDLPGSIHFGYAAHPLRACQLWYRWLSSEPPSLGSIQRTAVDVHNAAGFLASLSFSGAMPEMFQQLNAIFAMNAKKEEACKIADLLLCEPDSVLPEEFRREMPQSLERQLSSERARNRYVKIRASLHQYWDYCAALWKQEGIPAVYHPSLSFPEEKIFSMRDDMLYCGPDLLVGPNLLGASNVCSVYLPKGSWVHLWTSRLYPSGKATVYAPCGTPAVFL